MSNNMKDEAMKRIAGDSAQQAEPVAWHIGNADGSINKIGAVYIRRSLAEKHIASYEGELDAQIVPLYAAPQPFPEPKEPEHAHDWRFSLQDHLYKCDCGETRGDFPFGPATFKD